jgi:hypothetical protein
MAETEPTPTPPGVVAILTRPDGNPPVVAAHFDRSGPGGFTLMEAQQHYVREAVARKLLDEFVGWPIRKAISQYDATQIMDELIRTHGWKLHYEYIGHTVKAE